MRQKQNITLTNEMIESIKSGRKDKGLSQEELSNILHSVSLSKIKKIEAGLYSKLKKKELFEIYKALQLDINALINSEKNVRSFRLNENHMRTIKRVCIDNDFDSDSRALTFILENYERFAEENRIRDELLIDKLKPLFDFYFKNSLLPILKKILFEYKIDENILYRIEKQLDNFSLNDQKEEERQKEYSKLHVQKYQ